MTAEPLPGQIGPDDVVAWLVDQGFTAHASYDGRMPLRPSEVVVVTPTGGPGFSVEQAFDNVSFQVRCRGLAEQTNSGASARAMSWAVDFALVPPPMAASGPLTPCMIGTQFVNRVTRVGAPPAFLLRDAGGKTHYTCNYIFSVARC